MQFQSKEVPNKFSILAEGLNLFWEIKSESWNLFKSKDILRKVGLSEIGRSKMHVSFQISTNSGLQEWSLMLDLTIFVELQIDL